MREFQIEQRLNTLAAKHKIISWKWQSSRRGVPDRIVLAKGRVIFVELKAPNEKPTAQQLHVHALMRAQGADVRIIDSPLAVDELIAELTA